MTYYRKPSNVTYTQMCIWIDENAYKEDCDEYTLFQYLYHLAGMLAFKRRFFEKNLYYHDFSIFAATKIFLRLRDKRQFGKAVDKTLPRIKSILNYTKTQTKLQC